MGLHWAPSIKGGRRASRSSEALSSALPALALREAPPPTSPWGHAPSGSLGKQMLHGVEAARDMLYTTGNSGAAESLLYEKWAEDGGEGQGSLFVPTVPGKRGSKNTLDRVNELEAEHAMFKERELISDRNARLADLQAEQDRLKVLKARQLQQMVARHQKI